MYLLATKCSEKTKCRKYFTISSTAKQVECAHGSTVTHTVYERKVLPVKNVSGGLERRLSGLFSRVRTILALGYWVLGNICRYWVVLLLGDIFFSLWHPIRYRSDSSQHHPRDNHLDISGAAVASRWCQGEWGGGRVQAIHRHHHTVLRFYMVVLYIVRFNINSVLCYTVVLVLVLGIGIARGQYYWILDIGCLVWYRSNPTVQCCTTIVHSYKHTHMSSSYRCARACWFRFRRFI